MTVVLLLLPVSVFAQTQTPPSTIYISNDYVGVTVYTDGDDTSGLFEIWNVKGDTSIDSDDNEPILASGRALILMSGVADNAEAALPGWLTFEKGGINGIWGDIDSDGAWVVPPYVVPGEKCIKGVWSPTPDGDVPTFLLCELEIRLMHDQVRFKWTFTNNDITNHVVGLKMVGDVVTEPDNVGVVNGSNVVSAAGFPLIEEQSLYSPLQKITSPYVYPNTTAYPLPSTVEFYNSQAEPTRGVRVTMDGMNATKPDMAGIDEVSSLAGIWGYVPDLISSPYSTQLVSSWGYDPGPIPQVISSNLGYGAAWKPAVVRPGGKRTIIHYIGNAGANSVVNLPNIDYPRYTASVEGPRTLKYYIDPTTGSEQFGPSTFKITAFLENMDKYTAMRNCSYTLILPTGISLDPSETQLTKTITEIAPGHDGSVSWLVRADGNRTGVLSYYVAMNAYPMGGTIVKRDIHVPAVSKQSLYYGYQQFAVPFQLADTNPLTSLGIAGSMAQTRSGDRAIFKYNANLPASAPYYPYEVVQSITPGEAYWVAMSRGATTNMPGGNYAPKGWDDQAGYTIPVTSGWNMVGNPFVYTVTMGELRFLTDQYGSISYDQAVAEHLVSRTLYWWNTTFNTWNWSTSRTAQIKPWQGYWVKILDSRVQAVVITPAAQIGAGVGGTNPPSGGDNGVDDGNGPPPPGG